MNPNYPPSLMIEFLHRFKLVGIDEFQADIDLNFNGRRMLYQSKVRIELFDNYFELFLSHKGAAESFPEKFDSRNDIFWNESPDSFIVAGITMACSYKAIISPRNTSI